MYVQVGRKANEGFTRLHLGVFMKGWSYDHHE